MLTLAAAVTSPHQRPVQGVRSVVEQQLLHWRSPRESSAPPAFTPVELASRTRLAELAPESSSRPVPRNDSVAAFWRSLTNGRLCVVETFMAGGCCCAITEERAPRRASMRSPIARSYCFTARFKRKRRRCWPPDSIYRSLPSRNYSAGPCRSSVSRGVSVVRRFRSCSLLCATAEWSRFPTPT